MCNVHMIELVCAMCAGEEGQAAGAEHTSSPAQSSATVGAVRADLQALTLTGNGSKAESAPDGATAERPPQFRLDCCACASILSYFRHCTCHGVGDGVPS